MPESISIVSTGFHSPLSVKSQRSAWSLRSDGEMSTVKSKSGKANRCGIRVDPSFGPMTGSPSTSTSSRSSTSWNSSFEKKNGSDPSTAAAPIGGQVYDRTNSPATATERGLPLREGFGG